VDDEETRELLVAARREYSEELKPHFQIEEDLLLPGLDAAGKGSLVERTLGEHAELARLLEQAERGISHAALARFAHLLKSHVRFEERELFPAAEACLLDETLEQVWKRSQLGTR
jgi:hemerythrin-like domain-containing protein